MLVHQLFAVERPAFGEHRTVGELAQARAGAIGVHQLEVMAGIGLVHRGEGHAGVAVALELLRLLLLAPRAVHRRDEEVPRRVGVERRGREIGGIGRGRAQEDRRVDHLERFLRG